MKSGNVETTFDFAGESVAKCFVLRTGDTFFFSIAGCTSKGGCFVRLESFLFVSVQRVKIINFRRGELK